MENREKIIELIKIAELISHNQEFPDYESNLETRYKKATNKAETSEKVIYTEKDPILKRIIEEIWREAENNLPDVANYVENIGKDEVTDFLFVNPFSKAQGTARKLENFIRVLRIRNNIRVVALQVRITQWQMEIMKHFSFPDLQPGEVNIEITQCKSGELPPFPLPGEILKDWQNEVFLIYKLNGIYTPFDIFTRSKNNKIVGKLEFVPSPVLDTLKEADALQIKTCLNCLKIFFAEPRNQKFCSKKCGVRKRSKRYYTKHVQSA